MKKEVFEIIKTNLENRVAMCRKYLDSVISTEDLSNLTINQFKELKSFCKQEQIDMTEICMVDFYHVVGMGELTMTQQNVLMKLFKEYTSYRSDLKAISMMDSIDNLPNLPSRSSFKLHKLGNITLVSKLRGRNENTEPIIEEENISDYGEAKTKDTCSEIKINSLSIKGNILELDTADVDEVMKYFNPSGKKENLIKAARNCSAYCDVVWEFTDDSETHMKGFITSNARRDSIRDKMRNKGLII